MDGYAGKKHPAPAKNMPRATAVRLRLAALKIVCNLQAIGGFATALCSRYAVRGAASEARGVLRFCAACSNLKKAKKNAAFWFTKI